LSRPIKICRHIIVAALVFALGAFALAQSGAVAGGASEVGPNFAVTLDREPSHHLAIENQYIRAFKVEVAPHSSTLLHQHDRDYLFVTIGDSSVENDVQSKAPVRLELKDGEVHFTKGGFAHVARNLSDKPFRNITIELMTPSANVAPCDRTSEQCGFRANSCMQLGQVTCAVTFQIMAGDGFEVRETDIPAGLITPLHKHAGPHLAIALTECDLVNEVEGMAPQKVHMNAGDIAWIPAGPPHKLTNTGSSMARLIAVEFR